MVEAHHQAGIFRLASFVIPLSLLLILLLRSSFFPYPEILTEIYFLKAGMLPYTQINDQHFPGVMLSPVNLGTFGITTVGNLRTVHLSLIIVNFIILFKLLKRSRPVIKLTSLMLYSLFLFSWEGNTLWVDSFITTLALTGFYLLESGWAFRNSLSHLITGLIFGFLLTFKQHGIFLGLTAGIWVASHRPPIKQLGLFILGGILPMAVNILYLYQIGVFKDFWFWTVSHNLTGYAGLEGRWPIFGEGVRFLAVIFPALVVTWVAKRMSYPHLLFLLSVLFYVFPRFGLIHAQIALPIAVYLISRKLPLTLIVSLLLLGTVFTFRVLVKDTPGKIFFYDSNTQEIIDYVKTNTQSNKPIYVYGVNDNIYHLTQTLPPQKIWIELLKGNIIPGVEDTLISTLSTDPPQFVLVDPQASIDGQKIREFTPKIYAYLQDNFRRKINLSNGIEVWYAR